MGVPGPVRAEGRDASQASRANRLHSGHSQDEHLGGRGGVCEKTDQKQREIEIEKSTREARTCVLESHRSRGTAGWLAGWLAVFSGCMYSNVHTYIHTYIIHMYVHTNTGMNIQSKWPRHVISHHGRRRKEKRQEKKRRARIMP